MSTLDIKKIRKTYLGVSLFCMLFSTIYEYFSHGVYSLYMILPGFGLMIMGFLLVPILKKVFDPISLKLYNSFLAVTIVGSYIKGLLDIYGTTNDLWYVYPVFSIIFLMLTLIFIVRGALHEQ